MTLAPIIDASLSEDELRSRLRQAVDFIGVVATEIGEIPTKEMFGSKSLRDVTRHFNDIDTFLFNLTHDDIPF